jgi:carbamoyl-phosphate synthase small subunit
METPTPRRSSSPSNPHQTAPADRPVGRLALGDGTVFRGTAFGATGRKLRIVAEVVFNTAISGYQESLTDPSYTGQILVATFPLIGNVGINTEDVESRKVQVSGFVIRELARLHSNYRATQDLSSYLAANGVLGIADIDTRALTRKLRSMGVVPGVITDDASLSDAELVEMARKAPSMGGQNLVPLVGCSSGQSWSETLGEWSETAMMEPKTSRPSGKRLRVLALDCGAKANILRNLTDRGCEVRVVPHDTSAADIKALHASGQIDGLFISNGPGDPAAVEKTIATLREIVALPAAESIPTFGICLGHQLLALALGAKTYKLKFGHRGINQPVFNTRLGKVEITSQNHGFAVDPESLKAAGGEATHVHLNDGTLAGFRVPGKPIFSVQYHPEASPGPHDASYLFDEFVASMGSASGQGR